MEIEAQEVTVGEGGAIDGASSGRPRGRLDVTKDWNQPVGQPLYPPLPWHSRDGEHLAVLYETEADSLLEHLPQDFELAHDPPRLVAWLGRFDFCTGGGPYSECSPLIQIMWEGKMYHYAPAVYLGNDGCEEWFAAGREVWGHAKKQANIYIKKTEGRGLVQGWCERPPGRKLIDIVMGPFEGPGDPDELQFLPTLSVRTIPHPEKPEPESVVLLETDFECNVVRGSDGIPKLWKGPATVTISHSEQDPWYMFPVRKVLAGYYVSFNMTTSYPKIVKRYL